MRLRSAKHGLEQTAGGHESAGSVRSGKCRASGVAFNRVLTADMNSGKIDAYSIGPGLAIGEPVHVPSSQPNSRGWLLAEICREVGVDRYEQEIWVLSADDLEAGPVAQIKLPVAGRPQLHGCWVGADSLAQARVLK